MHHRKLAKPPSQIRKLRLERGLSQEQLAVRAGITRTTLAKLENTEAPTRTATLRAIAAALDVSVIQLVPSLGVA